MQEDSCLAEKEYMESSYNFKLILDDGRLMLYNTKTGAISVINTEEKDIALEIFANPNSYKENQLFIDLMDLGYIVEGNKNELEDIKTSNEWYSKLDSLIDLTLLPAEACNFTCPYCFIYQQRHMLMEDWVYEAIYKFIEKKTTENENGIYLRLSWFGGEPLLAKDKIIDFMNKLESLKSKHPVEIHASLITNGYLLTPSLFEKLVDCGITTYQVTLDGNADTHDTLRTLRDGSPTFDVIYNNLKGIKELTHPDSEFSFSVRANFLRNNVDSMKRLLDRFMTDFSEDKRFSIYFRPVYNFETTRDDIDPLTPDICTTSEGLHIQNELTFKSMSINTENTKLSKVTDPLPKPTYSWCPSIRANAYIIGADGAIFSCDTLMIDKKDSVGEITPEGDINFNSNAKLWKNTIFEEGNEIIKECTECKLLPICMGGCRRSRLISGQKPCFWTVEDIERSMKEYSKLSQANTNEP